MPKQEIEVDTAELLAQMPAEIIVRVDRIFAGKKVLFATRLRVAQELTRQSVVVETRTSSHAQAERVVRETTAALVREFRKAAIGGLESPDDEEGNPLQRRIYTAVSSDQPVQAFMFWGAGDKALMGNHEEKLISATTGLLEAIAGVYSNGAVMGVILADVHVVNNGYGEFLGDHGLELSDSARAYHDQVRERFVRLNDGNQASGVPIEFRVAALSNLYKQNGLTLRNGGPTSEDREAAARHAALLIANAGLYSRANVAPEESALSYVAMRRREQAILAAIPNAVLVAPSVSIGAGDIILPKGMPGVFLGGRAPWFQE